MRITVRVKPRASRPHVEQLPDGTYLVAVSAPPVEGSANEQMVDSLAEHFGVPRRLVRIVKGERGRMKIVDVQHE